MKKIKPMNGATLARWFKNNKLADLEKAFDGSVHELYDRRMAPDVAQLITGERHQKDWQFFRVSAESQLRVVFDSCD